MALTIPFEKLQAVKTVVTHANCPDGLASALLIMDALPGVRVLPMQYGTRALAELPAEEGILFCDFSPPENRAEEFRKVGTIVLDHHKQARSVVTSFEHHVFADEVQDRGVCGAVLAFRHVWLPAHGASYEPDVAQEKADEATNQAANFARLAGVRDTWLRDSPEWRTACIQASMLMFYPESYWLQGPGLQVFRNPSMLDSHMTVGAISLEAHEGKIRRAVDQSWSFTTAKGTRVTIFQNTSYSSDGSDLLGERADLVIGFSYLVEDGEKKLILSTRTRGTYDCGAFAKAHGGGGHTKAAGFTVPVREGDFNPYDQVQYIVRRYEANT